MFFFLLWKKNQHLALWQSSIDEIIPRRKYNSIRNCYGAGALLGVFPPILSVSDDIVFHQ